MPPPFRPDLLAFDIDSTLVTPELELLPEMTKVVRDCFAAGIRIAYLTNRRPGMAAEVVDVIGVPSLVATSSGCLSWTYPGWQCLDIRSLPAAAVKAGLQALAPYSVACYIYRAEGEVDFLLLARQHTSQTEAFLAHYGDRSRIIQDAAELAGEQVYKLAVIGDPSEIHPLQRNLPAELTGQVYCFVHTMRLITSPSLELNHPEANKGAALARFCSRLKIAQADVLAVGDGDNDIPMLSWAGHGVSMPCASAAIRAAANEQLEGNDQEILAAWLNQVLKLPLRSSYLRNEGI